MPLCAGRSTFHTKETTNAQKIGVCTFQGETWWTVECVKQSLSQLFPCPWLVKRLIQTFIFQVRRVSSRQTLLIIQAAKATLLSFSIKVTRCSVCRARCLYLAAAEMSLDIRVSMSVFSLMWVHVISKCITKLNALCVCKLVVYEQSYKSETDYKHLNSQEHSTDVLDHSDCNSKWSSSMWPSSTFIESQQSTRSWFHHNQEVSHLAC